MAGGCHAAPAVPRTSSGSGGRGASMVPCRRRSCASTPTPTTRPSPPAGPCCGPSSRATGSCSCSPPGARSARSPRGSSTPARPWASAAPGRPRPRPTARRRPGGVPRLPRSGMVGTPDRRRARHLLDGRPRGGRQPPGRPAARGAAEVSTVYDDNGAYGHPDHIQVHRVGVRAAELAGTPDVYESTINRDHLIRLMEARPEGLGGEDAPRRGSRRGLRGVGGLHHDGGRRARPRRGEASGAWRPTPARSATSRSSSRCPTDAFVASFGWEWYIRHAADGRPGSPTRCSTA